MRKAVPVILGAGLVVLAPCLFLVTSGAALSRAETCTPSPQSAAGAGTDGSGESQHWSETQRRNAGIITEVAETRALPPRAAVIAVATAIQESSLKNLEHGDRDSMGLFQQRPSQGWGSRAQLTDPVYSSNRFYDALLSVPDWENRPLTEVAQSVQRSDHPDDYARWEEAARDLVSSAWDGPVSPSVLDSCAGRDGPEVFDVDNPRSPAEAVNAARRAVDQTGWYRMCDQFVAQAYGYRNSGSHTANAHWDRLVEAGLTHPGDNSPPPGALLFYDTGQSAGHVALYLGDDQVASNDILDIHPGEGRIAIVPRHQLTDGLWQLNYRGWAEPGFPGAGGTSTI
ncbi:C40 family peptidase [Streptomyces sp. RFCAC02]|uniref:C40 family peptidase n=1 Tax=Streptomyces sp. RFCAC02 TaxID=2499143 RepID=UPI001F0D4813|nr:C40 family peptidase [Streptomyces sp. RFCAC02]